MKFSSASWPPLSSSPLIAPNLAVGGTHATTAVLSVGVRSILSLSGFGTAPARQPNAEVTRRGECGACRIRIALPTVGRRLSTGARFRPSSASRVPLRLGPRVASRDIYLHGRGVHGRMDRCVGGAVARSNAAHSALSRSGLAASGAHRRVGHDGRTCRRCSVSTERRKRARWSRGTAQCAARRAGTGHDRGIDSPSTPHRHPDGARSALHLRAPRNVLGVRVHGDRGFRLGTLLRSRTRTRRAPPSFTFVRHTDNGRLRRPHRRGNSAAHSQSSRRSSARSTWSPLWRCSCLGSVEPGTQ